MYQRLSNTAKDVLKLANQLARQDNQEYVGTEHVLLAILEHGLGVGWQVLDSHSITLSTARRQIESLARRQMEETWVLGRLPGTPHFKQVLAYAIEEAENVKDNKVGTEYLLLGLIREKGSVAEQSLRNLGLDLHSAQETIARLQGRTQWPGKRPGLQKYPPKR